MPRASLDARIDTEGRKKLAEVVQTSLAEDGTPMLLLLEMRGMEVKACFDGICLKQIFSSFDVARHHVKIGQQPTRPLFQ